MRRVAVRLCVDRPDAAGLLVDELQQVTNTVPAVCVHGCCVGVDDSVIALAALSSVPGPLASAAVARLVGRLSGSLAG